MFLTDFVTAYVPDQSDDSDLDDDYVPGKRYTLCKKIVQYVDESLKSSKQ